MVELRRPIKRELPLMIDGRPAIATMHAWGIELRGKRCRNSYPLSWSHIFNRAAILKAEELRKARREARKRRANG